MRRLSARRINLNKASSRPEPDFRVRAAKTLIHQLSALQTSGQERREDPRQEVQGRVEHAAVADRPDVRPRNAALAARAQEERDPFATDPVALARAA